MRKLKKRIKRMRIKIGRFQITWRGATRGKIPRSDPIHLGSTILYNVGPFAVFEDPKK